TDKSEADGNIFTINSKTDRVFAPYQKSFINIILLSLIKQTCPVCNIRMVLFIYYRNSAPLVEEGNVV
ncbi:hypothetical protein, partial [Niallia circulans]|uniref:hypothetical protein n=1 Tax=Niallia circulans TaxID=1397 RepID=UPI003523E6A3